MNEWFNVDGGFGDVMLMMEMCCNVNGYSDVMMMDLVI